MALWTKWSKAPVTLAVRAATRQRQKEDNHEFY